MDADATQRESCVLRNSPGAPACARRFVCSVLAEWALGDAFSDAPLVASELVTNAVRHAAGDVAVSIANVEGTVRITVSDGTEDLPIVRSLDEAHDGGWGLNIVDRLSSSWGLETYPRGKTVWCELAGSGRGASR